MHATVMEPGARNNLHTITIVGVFDYHQAQQILYLEHFAIYGNPGISTFVFF